MDNKRGITRDELLASEEYLLGNIQFELYHDIQNYLDSNDMSQTDFAKELNVTKGYVSQILNGDFDHKLSKLISLYKTIGIAVTGLHKVEMNAYLEADKIKDDTLVLKELTQIEFSHTEHKFDFELLTNAKLIRLDQRERSYTETEGAI